MSFTECCFPAAFKTAQVLPLLKKPGLDKEQMSSCRLISNLTTISKVIERLMLDRLRPHLLSSRLHILATAVSVRAGTSTPQRRHYCTVHVTAADSKRITSLVGLDISAAFNTIDHDVFASRIESLLGVVGGASRWLRSYLRGRQQFVRLGRHSSPMSL